MANSISTSRRTPSTDGNPQREPVDAGPTGTGRQRDGNHRIDFSRPIGVVERRDVGEYHRRGLARDGESRPRPTARAVREILLQCHRTRGNRDDGSRQELDSPEEDTPDDSTDESVGGFYVEDDDPGIPLEEREAVFEYGHSIANGGRGWDCPSLTASRKYTAGRSRSVTDLTARCASKFAKSDYFRRKPSTVGDSRGLDRSPGAGSGSL